MGCDWQDGHYVCATSGSANDTAAALEARGYEALVVWEDGTWRVNYEPPTAWDPLDESEEGGGS